MEIEGRRRSSNFEDRGRGGGGGGGIPVQALASVVRLLGFKGTLILGAVAGVGYLLLPAPLKQQLFGGAPGGDGTQQGSGSVCEASPGNGKACDFSRVVLASTEDVWTAAFQRGALPRYATAASEYRQPTLAVFMNSVATGCGNASSEVGPFYCPRDRKLYIDPSFYDVMERRLRAPGDFAQAYVIAHEVGHHVQNLIGATEVRLPGETENQISVRVELQADCFAGVWGHSARASLKITDEDLDEATTAAHAIGDDALGHANERNYTHGTSAQRKRWFRRGFEGGDARQCDTFAVKDRTQL
ncbi:MAG TPA: neutral zinc metallopeptidase [Polyangiaceae bacterium]